jgi:CRP-like cAMP-binding protein
MLTTDRQTDQLYKEAFKYISQFSCFDSKEVNDIVGSLNLAYMGKGKILLREGDTDDRWHFVLRGCVRQYYLIDGIEKTTAFFTERQGVICASSYYRQTLSDHYLACSEDSILITGNAMARKCLFDEFPKLEDLVRSITEEDRTRVHESLTRFIASSPEERYLNLLQTRPDLLQRIPLHQIASYLGMTAESLSRIRKRLASKKLLCA